jgi:hypothetical protein
VSHSILKEFGLNLCLFLGGGGEGDDLVNNLQFAYKNNLGDYYRAINAGN